MSTIAVPFSTPTLDDKFDNMADLLHSLCDVPPSRVIWTPRPGTATEDDLILFAERYKRLCELVDGTLVEKPLGFEESIIALNIASVVKAFVRSRKLGIVSGPDATLRMSQGNIRLPDVSFISAADLPGGKRPRVKVPKLPPTLTVEVVSETNTVAEIQQKLEEYFASGSKLAWVVYPKSKTIAVYEELSEQPKRILTIDQTLDGGPVLPGFSMSLADVFDISDFE